jgi:hypothetical protein
LHACPKEELKKAHRVAENTLARPIEVSAIEGVRMQYRREWGFSSPKLCKSAC